MDQASMMMMIQGAFGNPLDQIHWMDPKINYNPVDSPPKKSLPNALIYKVLRQQYLKKYL